MANALSLLRLFMAPPFGLLMSRPDAQSALYAALLFCAAVATDLFDGVVARRRGTASRLGGALDHAADFLFVSVGLAAMAWRGAILWVLPALVVLAFAQYVIDSLWVDGGRELRMSFIGRCNGILYFVPVGGDIAVRLGLAGLAAPVEWVAWLLVGTTLVSMADRLCARPTRLQRARDSRDSER